MTTCLCSRVLEVCVIRPGYFFGLKEMVYISLDICIPLDIIICMCVWVYVGVCVCVCVCVRVHTSAGTWISWSMVFMWGSGDNCTASSLLLSYYVKSPSLSTSNSTHWPTLLAHIQTCRHIATQLISLKDIWADYFLSEICIGIVSKFQKRL